MGLDMYMKKVEKITEQEKMFFEGLDISDYNNILYGCTFMHKEDFDYDAEMHSDLLPYVTVVSAIDKLFDWEKCWEDHGIEKDDDVVGRSYGMGHMHYSFASGKSIDMGQDEYEKYLYEKDVEIYVWKQEEVDYWRKYYALMDFIEETRIKHKKEEFDRLGKTPTEEDKKSWIIENCGHYEISIEERRKIRNFLLKNGDDSANKDYLYDEEAHIFFLAWW